LTICTTTNPTADLEVQFYTSVNKLDKEHWDAVVGSKNVYLSLDYLKAIEEGLSFYDFRYLIFYSDENVPIGVAYCQIIKITSADIDTRALVKRMGGMLPQSLINSLDLRILICGNAFASGENGYIFNDEIPNEVALGSLNMAIDEIHLNAKKQGQRISVTMIKEFWPESFDKMSYLKEKGYSEINIDVNMVLTLKEEWMSFEDYLSALNSKFRTKAKQVCKKSDQLVIEEFTVKTIAEKLDQIDELYNTIVDRANFSFGRLNASTLLEIKRALGKNFFFNGYYLGDRLIGFSTATAFEDVLDGNFIGLDYDYNQEYAVYQRMLYDFVKHAITIGAKQVKIGRTAEEIKSGVGAVPVEMKFYAKHRNKVKNALLKPFVANLKPSTFELRKPFKAEYYKS
jgi:predicted N-acyltransferase